MPTVKMGTTSSVTTKRNEDVIWVLDSPIVKTGHYLRVEVTSPSPFFETIRGNGNDAESEVKLNMSFSDGKSTGVTLTYSLYLVTAGPPSTEVLLAVTGPNLVIDTIGPPINPCLPEGKDESGGDDDGCDEEN